VAFRGASAAGGNSPKAGGEAKIPIRLAATEGERIGNWLLRGQDKESHGAGVSAHPVSWPAPDHGGASRPRRHLVAGEGSAGGGGAVAEWQALRHEDQRAERTDPLPRRSCGRTAGLSQGEGLLKIPKMSILYPNKLCSVDLNGFFTLLKI